MQINGCNGRSFNSPQLTVDDIRHVVEVCRRHGVAGLCPTLVTQSTEALLHGFAVLRRACETDAGVARAVPALHLEGPYISPEDGPRAPIRNATSGRRTGTSSAASRTLPAAASAWRRWPPNTTGR